MVFLCLSIYLSSTFFISIFIYISSFLGLIFASYSIYIYLSLHLFYYRFQIGDVFSLFSLIHVTRIPFSLFSCELFLFFFIFILYHHTSFVPYSYFFFIPCIESSSIIYLQEHRQGTFLVSFSFFFFALERNS